MQVTSRSQMSNGVQRVYCDLRNPSDLHCQLNVGLIVTDWGFADFYTVILTRSWLNYTNLDPDPGLWWVLAVINVRSDNLSQKQFLPLPTNSKWNQTSPQTWLKSKLVCRGTLIYTFLFLNPNPFRVLDPYIVISETPQICTVNSMLVWLLPTEALLIFIQSLWQGLGSITQIWTLILSFNEPWQW